MAAVCLAAFQTGAQDGAAASGSVDVESSKHHQNVIQHRNAEKPNANKNECGKRGPSDMICIPGGKFVMGLSPTQIERACEIFSPLGEKCEDDLVLGVRGLLRPATPQRIVELNSFWIDRDEVTNGEYRKCVKKKRCKPPQQPNVFDYPISMEKRMLMIMAQEARAQQDDLPVEGVSWHDARNYCKMIGRKLPTEAQWEKAARGTAGRLFPWGDHPPDCDLTGIGCEENRIPSPACSSPEDKSPYGVCDMAGSVTEWVADAYNERYHEVTPARNPKVKKPQEDIFGGRSYRGGAPGTGTHLVGAVAAYRWNDSAEGLSHGFRCAK